MIEGQVIRKTVNSLKQTLGFMKTNKAINVPGLDGKVIDCSNLYSIDVVEYISKA